MSRVLRVAVCLPQVPFERGGAEILAEGLVGALRERGHAADLVTVPYRWHPTAALLENALTWRMLDLTEVDGRPVDVLIGTKFPSYLARHPRKVVWLFHQFRQAYELHGTPFAQFGDDPEGAAMRDAVRRMDAVALGEARALFTISANTAARLERYNGMAAEVLLPPPQRLDLAWRGDEGFFLAVGRLDRAKRNDLLLRALALTPAARAVVVGEGPDRPRLESLVGELGLNGRVELPGRVGEERLADLYGRCRAVFFAPYDEDFGLVAAEAQLAGKAVLTTADAGGALELVEHERSGVVAEPEPAAVAAALARLDGDPELARRLGAAGGERVRGITWDDIVERLLAAVA